MIETVEKTITQYRMLTKGDTVVIGISGGPDSVALGHILSSLQEKYKLTLHLAHLNHLLREEAKEEAVFVQELAESLNLPVTIEEIDIAQDTSRNFSIEQKARKVRYEFLIRVTKGLKATKIALAHHFDDNLETIMMWLIRGCGAEGFGGIPPVRKIDTQPPGKPVFIIRPLINITKQEIEHYLKEHKLSFKIDSSNLKKDYLRNKIRLELLPRLEEYNPNIKEALSKLSLLWEVDNEYLNFLSTMEREVILENGAIDLKRFSELHQAIQSRVLRQIIEEVKGNLEGITFKHIEAILNLIKDGPAQGSLDLPANIKVKREYTQLWICQGKSEEREKGEERYLIVPGITEIEGRQIETKLLPKEAFSSLFPSPSKAYLDYDKLKLPILVRHRKCGDKFHPYGMAGTKKIKDFLIDLKVAKKVRDTAYLLEDGQGIIWIMGFNRIDERVKITEATKNVLVVEEQTI
ncbi:MAG: tRNA lysidine(34) synthetase TilS [bacterium]|nr:tRNA lysidine(34) synthetase TilS [bacterium]